MEEVEAPEWMEDRKEEEALFRSAWEKEGRTRRKMIPGSPNNRQTDPAQRSPMATFAFF